MLVEHDILRQYSRDIAKKIHDNGGTICGGKARYLASLNDVPATDIDIYPCSQSSFDELNKYFIFIGAHPDKIKNYNGVESIKYYYQNELDDKLYDNYQLIRLCDTPENIIKDFDITVCQAYLNPYTNKVITPDYWLQHETLKKLVIVDNDKERNGYRLIKYMNKDYSVDYNTIIKFLSNLKIKDNRAYAEEYALWLGAVYYSLEKKKSIN